MTLSEFQNVEKDKNYLVWYFLLRPWFVDSIYLGLLNIFWWVNDIWECRIILTFFGVTLYFELSMRKSVKNIGWVLLKYRNFLKLLATIYQFSVISMLLPPIFFFFLEIVTFSGHFKNEITKAIEFFFRFIELNLLNESSLRIPS